MFQNQRQLAIRNIDDISGKERPVHSTLPGAEILIVEHMCNLDGISHSSFRFYAVPVKIEGFESPPVQQMKKTKEIKVYNTVIIDRGNSVMLNDLFIP
ncbi:MAG: hypothetical protein U9N32_01760 [Spirochaetota bacterium]|nr:hypothetical protein [Spirochaetota bacterium]